MSVAGVVGRGCAAAFVQIPGPDQAIAARIFRCDSLSHDTVQCDIVDQDHARGTAAVHTDCQFRDALNVQAGQVNVKGKPTVHSKVSVVHDLGAVDLGIECAGIAGLAPEGNGQGDGTANGPVLRHGELALGLRRHAP